MKNLDSTFLQLVSRVGFLFRQAKTAFDGDLIARNAWGDRHSRRRTEERETLLEPNKGSKTKIERYDFSLNTSLVIGSPSQIDMTCQPNVTFRPQKLMCNVPCPGFVLLDAIQTANVNCLVGVTTDAYHYSPLAGGSALDCPTLSPANRANIIGNYSGLCPGGRRWKGGPAVQAQLEAWWAENMPGKSTLGPVQKKGKKMTRKKTVIPARFPFDVTSLLNTDPTGPYPEGSAFLFVATFQGPATIVC